MANIKDVAKRAGVSVGTVSRVFAKNDSVKQPLRERVLEAAQALDYRPNFAARALRLKSQDAIGLIVPDVTNPFYAKLAKLTEQYAREQGHLVVLSNSDDDHELETALLSALAERSLKGILVAATKDTIRLDPPTDIPVIAIDRAVGVPLVATDHKRASALMADHIHQLGHQKIAYLSGPDSAEVSRLRRDGFLGRLAQLQSAAPEDHILMECEFDFASGEAAARQLFEANAEDRPTALVCASDQIAIGALRAARDAQISVPAEISISGFDDIELASLVVPRLTTIRQSVENIARNSVRRLLMGDTNFEKDLVSGELIARGSTASPPN